MSDLVVNVHSVVTKLVKRMERIIGIAVKCRAGIRPDPHITLIVRTQCGYEICIKSQLFTIICNEAGAVEAIQSIFRGHPDKSVGILGDGVYVVERQSTILRREMRKTPVNVFRNRSYGKRHQHG